MSDCTQSCDDCVRLTPLVDQPPDDREWRAEGVFVKQLYIRSAGTYVPQHSHKTGHLTMLARGSVRVWKDGVIDRDYEAPQGIFIPAHVKHTFLSLEDETTLYCIHSTPGNQDVEIAEHNSLPFSMPK